MTKEINKTHQEGTTIPTEQCTCTTNHESSHKVPSETSRDLEGETQWEVRGHEMGHLRSSEEKGTETNRGGDSFWRLEKFGVGPLRDLSLDLVSLPSRMKKVKESLVTEINGLHFM